MAKSRSNTPARSGQLNISARSAAAFVACFVALYVLASMLPAAVFEPLNRHTAGAAAHLLNVFGFHPILADTVLSRDGFAVSIVTECSVLYMGILYISFVAAYPAALREKLIGITAGLALLHLGNLLRIALVFAVGVKARTLFEVAHVYLGQVLMVLFVVALCLMWVRTLLTDGTTSRPVAFISRVIAFSSIPFVAWVAFNRAYVQSTDHAVIWLFSLCKVPLGFNYEHQLYYQTFNLVTFAGLVLASRFRRMKRKLSALATGAFILMATHMAFRICNGLMITFGMQAAYTLSAAINIVGQYLLPIALWLAFIRQEHVPEKKPPKKNKKPYLPYRWPYTAQGEG